MARANSKATSVNPFIQIAVLTCLLGITLNAPLVLGRAYAQETSNPLELNEADPLLPETFNPPELEKLEQALETLNTQAATQLSEGNGDNAFEIWFCELRLRRAMGRIEEIKALGRIGEIAWRENRTPDVKIITKRLLAIQEELEEEGGEDQETLSILAQAYEQVRALKQAAEIYQRILANARQARDRATIERALKVLGRLYLDWFEYSSAATVYEELLELAKAEFDDFNTTHYLEQLAYIYDRATQPEKAIDIKLALIAAYQKKEETAKQLATQISLGNDYTALDRAETASQTYQETFTLAWAQKQFTYASESLQRLAELYEKYNQFDYALQVYQEQTKVQTIADDRYGLMNTYDRIGLIYLEQRDYDRALDSFQSGLQLAQALSYREAYFETQVERTIQGIDRG
ncbi:tetratricopeptide repeat protein [Lusitaniella coriacea]|uniref:tetratricopeptide repeat protein n=1 Tax=Lusitaniella coriacea TaxID=1983105 RepID=UPI003CE8B07B